MEMPESSKLSWKYVTANELLSHGACELLYARLTGATDAGIAILYDGENAQGTQIIELNSGGLWNCDFQPTEPVYCRRGLFVGGVTTVDGVFVQWRNLSHRGSGG